MVVPRWRRNVVAGPVRVLTRALVTLVSALTLAACTTSASPPSTSSTSSTGTSTTTPATTTTTQAVVTASRAICSSTSVAPARLSAITFLSATTGLGVWSRSSKLRRTAGAHTGRWQDVEGRRRQAPCAPRRLLAGGHPDHGLPDSEPRLGQRWRRAPDDPRRRCFLDAGPTRRPGRMPSAAPVRRLWAFVAPCNATPEHLLLPARGEQHQEHDVPCGRVTSGLAGQLPAPRRHSSQPRERPGGSRADGCLTAVLTTDGGRQWTAVRACAQSGFVAVAFGTTSSERGLGSLLRRRIHDALGEDH